MWESEIDASVRYLASDAATASFDVDPYWPKWDGPWWHMMVLDEMGLAERIPRSVAEAAAASLRRFCFKIFLMPHQLPEEPTLSRHIPCHCQVATGYRMLRHAGLAVDDVLPWMRPWLTAYGLPDGGVNCDERVYPAGKSSLVSTVAVAETLLWHLEGDRTAEEESFLDAAVQYLIEHRLVRSRRGDVLVPAWLVPRFPRFYELDFLRSLRVVLGWARRREARLPLSAVEEGMRKIRLGVRIAHNQLADTGSLYRQPDGTWRFSRPAALYPLLEAISRPGFESPTLTNEARQALDDFTWLERHGLIQQGS